MISSIAAPALRPDLHQPAEPDPRERPGRPDLRHRQHRHRRAAVGLDDRRPLRQPRAAGAARHRQARSSSSPPTAARTGATACAGSPRASPARRRAPRRPLRAAGAPEPARCARCSPSASAASTTSCSPSRSATRPSPACSARAAPGDHRLRRHPGGGALARQAGAGHCARRPSAPRGCEAGTLRLVGTDPERIFAEGEPPARATRSPTREMAEAPEPLRRRPRRRADRRRARAHPPRWRAARTRSAPATAAPRSLEAAGLRARPGAAATGARRRRWRRPRPGRTRTSVDEGVARDRRWPGPSRGCPAGWEALLRALPLCVVVGDVRSGRLLLFVRGQRRDAAPARGAAGGADGFTWVFLVPGAERGDDDRATASSACWRSPLTQRRGSS